MAIRDFTGCNALVYDEIGNLLAETRVLECFRKEWVVVVEDSPNFANAQRCSILILTSPLPLSYKGTLQTYGARKIIKLYQEKASENRKEARHNISLPAIVECLIFDSKLYKMHTALPINIVNISRRGCRFYAQNNSFALGNGVFACADTEGGKRIFTAEVVNTASISLESSAYGCRFIAMKGGDSA